MTANKKRPSRHRQWSRMCAEIEAYRNFPGDSGKSMRLAWCDNDAELDADFDREAKARHRRSGGFGSTYRGR